MTPDEYTSHDGIGLATAIKNKDFSADEVTKIAIKCLQNLNPSLNAVTLTNFDNAQQRSRELFPDTPLAGVPFLLKDVNVYTHDMPTTFSSRFFANAEPRKDSEIVTKIRNAGLVILGKTNTPEFAEDFVTEPTFRGTTYNPWTRNLTTGGSSGGAAAAVAAGIVPIAHGTDLGGSIRIPAACCGVYGFKPTSGLSVVNQDHPELANGFNSDHVLTRSVRDSAAVLDVTAGHKPGYRYRTEGSVKSYLAQLDLPLRSLTIGVCLQTPGGLNVIPSQQDAVAKTAEALQLMGHNIVKYQYPEIPDMGIWNESLWMIEIAELINNECDRLGRQPQPDELEAMSHFLRKVVDSASALDYYRARTNAHRVSMKLMQSMSKIDVVLSPALAEEPLEVGTLDSRTDKFDFDEWLATGYRFAPFSTICNITGQPAASLPVQLYSGQRPNSVQIAGHTGEDHIILQLSRALESHFVWRSFQPPVWAGSL